MRRRQRSTPSIVLAGALLVGLVGCTSTELGTAYDLEVDRSGVVDDAGRFVVDPDVRVLTLDNGLTVYLRQNEVPGRSAELRLVVNAGSVHETADQVGVAHFLEHMLFNGTESWPGNELITQLREFGMEFGADVNAYTSYDETVYQLSVPAGPGSGGDDSPVATGLDILAEWLTAATLDPAEVERERGVVLDEWRGSESFDGRLDTAIADMYLADTVYRDHPPIGGDAAIAAIDAAQLRAFYDTWYRPDNAAIVVVGDLDLDDLEERVRERFGGLVARIDAASVPAPPAIDQLPAFDADVARVFVDPDTSVAEVEVALPGTWSGVVDEAGLRATIVTDLAFEMLATRLADDVTRGEAAFSDAYQSSNSLVRWLEAPSVVVTANDASTAGIDTAVEALLGEFERADRFGFSETELERALAARRAAATDDYDRRDATGDAEWSAQYVQHFLDGSPPMAPFAQRTALLDVYDTVTADEVGSVFADRYAAAGAHVLLMAPDTAEAVPTDAALLEVVAARAELDVAPRADVAPVDTELMAVPDPVVETEVETWADDPYSFLVPTMLTFPNGARVVLNPSELSDEHVTLMASSPGGLSLVADDDVPEGNMLVEVVTASGLGELDAVQFDTMLSATSVEVYPYLDVSAEQFFGSSTSDDVETMLQVVASYLERPRFDQLALDQSIESWRPYVDDPDGDVDLAFLRAYFAARFGDEPRFSALPTAADLDALDLPTVERVWRERFGGPGDWVFVLSGDFELDEMTDLVRRYVGSLVDDGRPVETPLPLIGSPPEGNVRTDVRSGTGEKASLTRVFEVPIDATHRDRDRVVADLVSSLLTNRLTDRVREELGASYSPYGVTTVYREPDDRIETVVQVTGDPDGIDDLDAVVSAELDDLRTAGPTDAELFDARSATQQSYDLFDDDMLAEMLMAAADDITVLEEFIDRRDTLADVSFADVRTFLARTMPADRSIEIRVLPA